MKQWKRLLGIFMSGAVLMTGSVLPQKSATTAERAADYGISNPRIENGVTTWDKIKFGSYYQDAEMQPEPIKWRVLSVDGDDAFLLADQILDAKPYNEIREDVTWETCTLRKWLNEDFYNEAFDADEKKAVMETMVVNENNPYNDTEGGNDTKDKVYLLSIAEASNAAYGFDTQFKKKSETRKSKKTDYAKVNNLWCSSDVYGDWWLRSPGDDSIDAVYVSDDGYGIYFGYTVHDWVYGVRPALHINLSSFEVEDAGEVNSEGNVTMLGNGIGNPVVKDGVTTWDCVYFGNYRQNCTFKKQDIEWRVLSVDGDEAFLLADRILDCKWYNEEYEDVTWETCTLRKWLNNDFYNEAFDDEEKKAVMETIVANKNNPYNYTEGGNDTKDKVYLLSIAEAANAAYGFDMKFYEKSKTREAKSSDYAKVNNVDSNGNGYGNWWLRSPGSSGNIAVFVCDDGYCLDYAGHVDYSGYGVRPALHINLSSSSWSKADDKPTVSPKPTKKPAEEVTEYGISNPRIENGVTTWDKIKFGRYYQDAEVQPAEPIKWRVLSVDGDDAFLLADKILDAKPYNEERKGVTWEACTLRKWLNQDFYNEAFDDEEKKAVMETTVVNESNPLYNTDGGNDTKDKVYLLSIAEACNSSYGFYAQFGMWSETRKAKNTDYAKVNNVQTSTYGDDVGVGDWWLRSPGWLTYASCVDSSGYGHYGEYDVEYVDNSENGVRPVLHINLSSSKVTDAGEVDSEGNVTASADGIRAPRVKDGVSTWDCVYFGRYSQNCTFKKQDIEWRVLSVDGDDAFLLADKILDAKPYNEEYEGVTWETCTLRKWLNNDFYNEAFDDEEKKAVMETTVVNENNPFYNTDGGNDTKDKVYLLSITEASAVTYGFDTEFEEFSKTREAKNTDYVKVNNVRNNSNGIGYWWLRSPGNSRRYASDVICGELGGRYGNYYGDNVDDSGTSVRPTLHINLSSSSWSKAGQINSDGEVIESTPTPSPEPTKEPTPTDKPTTSAEPTKEPLLTDSPTSTPEPTKEPTPSDKPTSSMESEQTQAPTVTAQLTPPAAATQNPASAKEPVLKQLKLSSVKCTKNTKKITGKVSVSKATIKIKVGKKVYKKATVKGKKFTLKLNYKLKKKTKVIIKAEKKGYKSLVKSYTVK